MQSLKTIHAWAQMKVPLNRRLHLGLIMTFDRMVPGSNIVSVAVCCLI